MADKKAKPEREAKPPSADSEPVVVDPSEGEEDAPGYGGADPEPKKRNHKATYATNKRDGGYLIRVSGPFANRFAERDVPVTRMDGTESLEHLTRLIWTGKDNRTGEPCALYHFQPKPKQREEDIPF